MADDYYELLEVEQSATPEEIRAAITRQRRIWVRRQSSPDPERRAYAEQRVREIDAAEKILLDPLTRQAYDTARVEERRSAERPAARSHGRRGGGAEPGTRAGGAPDDVLSDDVAAHLAKGEAYLDQGRWRLAQAEFEYVRERAPREIRALCGLGSAHVGAGRVKEGLAILERAFEEHPDDEDVKRALAGALYDSALAGIGEVSDRRMSSRRAIVSRRQLWMVRSRRRRIKRLGLTDWQTRMYVDDLTDLIKQARKPVWTRSYNLRFYMIPFAGAALMAFVPSMHQLRLIGAFWMVLIAGIYVVRHRQPGWKRERRFRRR